MKTMLTSLLVLTAAACSPDGVEDKAWVCSGMERALPTHAASAKPALPYRSSMELYQVRGQILLTPWQATPWRGTDGKLHFRADLVGGWMAGQLDESSGALNLIVERPSDSAGALSSIRTVGDYACVLATGPLLKGRSR